MSADNVTALSVPSQKFELALIAGDLSKLAPEERLAYYKQTCDSLGLNALTRPFDYINLNGKLTLYAKRDCTDQLRRIHRVSIKIVSREQIGDLLVVTASASTPDGRHDESIGAVASTGLKGDNLANAMMKCETKAKRRVTLSLCGLGILDESEIETIPQSARVPALPVGLVDDFAEVEQKTIEEQSEEWRPRFEAAQTPADIKLLRDEFKKAPHSTELRLMVSKFYEAAKARIAQ